MVLSAIRTTLRNENNGITTHWSLMTNYPEGIQGSLKVMETLKVVEFEKCKFQACSMVDFEIKSL